MSLTYFWLVLFETLLVFSLLSHGKASRTPFQLIFKPAHIVKKVTHNVSLQCAYTGNGRSKLSSISRIRLLKKLSSGWHLVAELRDNEDIPFSELTVPVTAYIGPRNVQDTYLRVKWPVATEETLGTYRCDVIGFETNTFANAAEISAELVVSEENVTTGDMLDIFDDTKDEMHHIEEDTHKLQENVDSLNRSVIDLSNSDKILLGWPAGQFALLQPRTGCPIDLTFFGGSHSYFKIHTEINSDKATPFRPSSVLPSWTTSLVGTDKFFTLTFCEANGALNTESWPDGTYCINKVSDVKCPRGFYSSGVNFDTAEFNNRSTDHKSWPVFGKSTLEFCCKSSGSAYKAMVLPTHSPFLLYRFDGTCQAVKGMRVDLHRLTIDKDDRFNGDSKFGGDGPDMELSANSPVTFHLCYYVRE